eukprot:CAMPEP_0174709278 /NCGR_PEP_ID=MMETSP1094-20130205/11287_1 /TAXON_ID=156173 /ORGANISM="Chrysochromulina brevifilum, Strain UTEX LB 985" /LENGTH=218 /DNA_ID=CAMNT_0015907941 /DNA_START=79 /DNA_END=736 /DNA_ORIENTATION=-
MSDEPTEATPAEEPTVDSKGRAFITKEELEKHTTREDVWMSIHGKVYNVSKYLEDHPGGEEVLMDRGGKDATEDYEDVGHSNEARKQLVPYEVGELPPSQRNEVKASGASSSGGGLSLIIPVVVVAIAAGYYYYTTQMADGEAASAATAVVAEVASRGLWAVCLCPQLISHPASLLYAEATNMQTPNASRMAHVELQRSHSVATPCCLMSSPKQQRAS